MQWSKPHPEGIKICQIPENEKVGPVMNVRVCTVEMTRNDYYSKKPMVDPYSNEVVNVQKLTVQAKIPAWGDLAREQQEFTWITVCQDEVQFLIHFEHTNNEPQEKRL